MDTSNIEVRIQNLERRLNRYRSVSIVLGLALVGLAGIAANAPQGVTSSVVQDIRARKIVIVDDKGKEMVHLLTGVHGGVLNLFSSNGIPVVRIGAGEKGGKVALADPKGDQYLQLTSEETGGEVVVSDKKGTKNQMRPAPAR
jgi:hypothetical protein